MNNEELLARVFALALEAAEKLVATGERKMISRDWLFTQWPISELNDHAVQDDHVYHVWSGYNGKRLLYYAPVERCFVRIFQHPSVLRSCDLCDVLNTTGFEAVPSDLVALDLRARLLFDLYEGTNPRERETSMTEKELKLWAACCEAAEKKIENERPPAWDIFSVGATYGKMLGESFKKVGVMLDTKVFLVASESKRRLYYCPSLRLFFYGTSFGRESNFQIIDAASAYRAECGGYATPEALVPTDVAARILF